MKNALLVTMLSLAIPGAAAAQQLQLPRPSPNAKVSYTVGLTEVTVDYSSPGVKGRKIWGGVVPLDQVWRAGANAATKVTFAKDVTIEGKAVPAGSYSFFAVPGKATWTLIINKDATASAQQYKQTEDVVRVTAKPTAIPHRERLAYLISDATDNGARLDLEWEKVRVSLPFKTATDEQALASIKTLSDGGWGPWNAAARYMLESKKDYDGGLKLVDQSIAIKETWNNLFTKAQLLAGKGDFKQAYPLAARADALGKKSPDGYFLEEEVKKSLSEWKNKLSKS
jgi:hypothetical protein